jgi:hypothetical protein
MKINALFIALIIALLMNVTAVAEEKKDIDDVIKDTDAGKMSVVAEQISFDTQIRMIGANSAPQVSQVADQAQLKYSAIIIKQNDEIIRLLRGSSKGKK